MKNNKTLLLGKNNINNITPKNIYIYIIINKILNYKK